MRMLKCYLANNRRGHFVTADEAMSAPGIYGAAPHVAVVWRCMQALPVMQPGLNTTSAQWRNMY
ncbi:hypothetical protein [Methylophaga sp.]|uniref:hypothetical protein n=1 Tax=Methylophaga sp. TaxID=2024840 RepID=UPI003A8DAFF7